MRALVFNLKKEKAVRYFFKERLILKIAGLSFTGHESIIYRIYSFFIILSINFMYPMLQLCELFKQELDVVFNMLMYLSGIQIGLAKTLVTFRHRIQFGKMLNRLEDEPFVPNFERGGIQEEKLIQECVRITNFQTLGYWAIAYGAIFSNIIYAIIARVKSNDPSELNQPFGSMTVINVTKSPNYEIILFYQSLSCICIGFHFTTIDLLMASFLAHLSYQFKILQHNIRRIMRKSCEDMQKDSDGFTKIDSKDFKLEVSIIPKQHLEKNLKEIVEYHLEITNLATDLESVFNTLLLIIFLGTLGLLCFSIYRVSMVTTNIEIIISVLNISTCFLQVLCVCYWGEQVLSESQLVGRAAYESNFVGSDLGFQKGLALIIRRSQNPTSLTAGKYADICLATFTWVVRTSYSAFMVVRGRGTHK